MTHPTDPHTPSRAGCRVAILTSGGDAPGMNAAIRAATLLAVSRGWEVLGILHGYRGLVDGKFQRLTAADVRPIQRRGGTILGSARCPDFFDPRARQVARTRLREAGIEALLVIGGNGSLAGAHALSSPAECGPYPIRVAGVPASIDNDIGFTELAIGVDTALNTIAEACDKIADTADAHERAFLVEVMGRRSGYLAMTSAVAAGADAVLYPELGRSQDEIVDIVTQAVWRARDRPSGSRRVLVIKAEGVAFPIDELKRAVDERLRSEPGVDPSLVAETRVTVLGHLVRGGRPSALDRLLATRLANAAMSSVLDGGSRRMAAWLPPVMPPPEVAIKSPIDPSCWLIEFGAVLVETERLDDHSSPLVEWRRRVFDRLATFGTLGIAGHSS
jgi:6-phosphofructokinase 1